MKRTKLILSLAFIGAYISALTYGVVGQTLKDGTCGVTLSYFVVWDMFCGWTAWDQRIHVIAEGESGKYYEVKEPWGEFHPFGHVGRIHYDYTNHLLPRHIDNIISHTAHESISNVYVVEEVWPKQYNVPKKLFDHYFARPNDKLSYYHLRAVCMDDGMPVKLFPDWHAQQQLNSVYDNPRLRQQAAQATSLYSTLFTPKSADGTNSLTQSLGSGLTTN